MERVKHLIHFDRISSLGLTGKHVTIAFLDTGISSHRDFLYPTNRILCFRDFVYGHSRFYDDNGHGTHITGIASSNLIGIAPHSNIVSLKVLNRHGNGQTLHLIRCFQWILAHHDTYNIRIVNISMGMSNPNHPSSKELLYWVERLWDEGLIVCTAAGNLGPSTRSITIPGISRKIITVGSFDGSPHTSYSGRGPTHSCIVKPDLTAPGNEIKSCYGVTRYTIRSGTSMATPVVCGAIALYLEKFPASTNKDIKLKLRSSCDDLGYPQNQQGWGRINLEKFLRN